MRKLMAVWLIVVPFLAGCAVNPVTGERELILVSGAQEIQMGAQN